MNKPLLLLVALTFCCCIASLHGFPINTCRCRRTVANPIPPRAVKKIEVTPASGHCPRTEITITVRNGNRICVDPEAKWFPGLLNTLQKKRGPPTAEQTTVSSF
ncbi:C-X-C motif chemokine 10 [Pundamilia nyererei]|uniref:C-X-C motif chemokine 10 n=1 Tax=Pundamilia nyererei TaxID=303518 RepID=A0A9Y3VBI3_9CICH|nr:PREDICTED: C-X-C motif chemokine 13 [Pundamilia nyererei]